MTLGEWIIIKCHYGWTVVLIRRIWVGSGYPTDSYKQCSSSLLTQTTASPETQRSSELKWKHKCLLKGQKHYLQSLIDDRIFNDDKWFSKTLCMDCICTPAVLCQRRSKLRLISLVYCDIMLKCGMVGGFLWRSNVMTV